MAEIVKMRGEGLETVGWSERGWGVVALPFQRVHLVYSKTNYDTVTKTRHHVQRTKCEKCEKEGKAYALR